MKKALLLFSLLFFSALGILLYVLRDVPSLKEGIAIVVGFFILYALAMWGSSVGMTKMNEWEYILVADPFRSIPRGRMLLWSLLASLPLYFCYAVICAIPIASYQAWLMTGFPVLLLAYFPTKSIYDVYHHLTKRSALFWLIQGTVYLSLLLGGQLVAQTYLM